MTKPVIDVYNFIYNLAYNMLECHHLSLDMAQQIFLYYNKKIEDNPQMDEGYKRFWLIRVTKNKCSNHIRNNKKISFLDPVSFIDSVDHSPNPRQIIEQNEEKQELYNRLKKNISTLPDSQKRILHLKFYEELPYSEITKITGYTLTKVKCIVCRAMKILRVRMK